MKTVKLGLQMFDSPGGKTIANWTNRALDIEESNGEHGFEIISFNVPLSLPDRFRFYDQAPMKHLSLNYGGGVVWEGRVEDREITATGLRITALGYWAALADGLYNALWSDVSTTRWNIVSGDQLSGRVPERYQIDIDDTIHIALMKNAAYGNATDICDITHVSPHNGSQSVVGFSCSYEMLLPANWDFDVLRQTDDLSSQAIETTITATGSAQSGCINIVTTAQDRVGIRIFNNSGSTTNYSGETGANYLRLLNVRVVTSTTNRVNTTTTTSITAGSDRVVTPASMTGIYAGQLLQIDQQQTTAESVVVKSITASTFTADFVNAYSGTTTIHAHVVYADEIVDDVVSTINTLNSSQLSSSTALVESPAVDILNAAYVDTPCNEVVNSLLGYEATGDRWEAGVWEGQILHYRARGSQARTFYTDARELQVNSTAASLRNQFYATYQDVNGRVLRTAVADDDASQSRYGVVRQAVTHSNSTNSTLAGTYRDAALDAAKDITPSSQVMCRGLYTAGGAQVPFWMIRAGDTLTIRNLPPNASIDIDKIRTFTVSRMTYYPNSDDVSIVPETDIPSIEIMIGHAWIPQTPKLNTSMIVTDAGNPFGSAVTGTVADPLGFG